MLSRALILAAVIAVFGMFAAQPVWAQNLEAGKPPSQIFSSTCSICHKSSRGLLKSVSPGSLPGFLREHYTTSRDMAATMAAFVLSNGAANAPLPGGNLTKQGQDSRTAPKPDVGGPEQAARDGTKDGTKGRKPQREASRPDVDGLSEVPGGRDPAAAEGSPADASKPGAKQKAAKGKAGRTEPPKDEAKTSEPAKDEVARADGTRPDPVPQVTPAAQGSDTAVAAGPKTVAELPTGPLTIDLGTPTTPPPVAAAAPLGPPAGPPRVPVSQ